MAIIKRRDYITITPEHELYSLLAPKFGGKIIRVPKFWTNPYKKVGTKRGEFNLQYRKYSYETWIKLISHGFAGKRIYIKPEATKRGEPYWIALQRQRELEQFKETMTSIIEQQKKMYQKFNEELKK